MHDLTMQLSKTERLNCPTLQRAHRGVALNEKQDRLRDLKRERARLKAMTGLTDIIIEELSAAIERERAEMEGV